MPPSPDPGRHTDHARLAAVPSVYASSINGERGKFGQSAYAASKAGLHGLAKTVAREVRRFGIRVNVTLPGWVRTPDDRRPPRGGEAGGPRRQLPGTSRRTRGHRLGDRLWVSPAAGHITGQVIRADGASISRFRGIPVNRPHPTAAGVTGNGANR